MLPTLEDQVPFLAKTLLSFHSLPRLKSAENRWRAEPSGCRAKDAVLQSFGRTQEESKGASSGSFPNLIQVTGYTLED